MSSDILGSSTDNAHPPDSIHAGHAPGIVKISQRASKSCTECIRRKNRCNKQIPCDVCVKRNVAHLCRLDSIYRSTDNTPAPTDFASILQGVLSELESVKTRLDVLEQERTGVTGATGVKRRRLDTETVISDESEQRNDAEPQDAATTLEFMALGMDRRVGPVNGDGRRAASPRHRTVDASRRSLHILTDPDRPFPDSVLDALLPRDHVQAILRFAESFGLWQHCCILFSRFWTEVDEFWDEIGKDDKWERVEPTWVALLYTLLGIAVHQMSEQDATACGLAEADRFVLPNAFISAAEDALYHGQFLSRPTIWTVQAVAMLTLCGQNVCESDLLSSLLAVGIKIAQTLKLHTLGSVSKRHEGRLGKQFDTTQIEDLELGKRLWWSLAQEDWFGIPFRGVWYHFDTPMPFNCHDNDLREGRYCNRPNSELTVAFKQRFSSHMSSIVRNVFHRLRRPGGPSPFDIATEAGKEIQLLLSSIPTPAHTQRTAPRWANAMRHYLFISATHKIIIVYRAALGSGGNSAQRAAADAACVAAAEAIVEELDRGGREEIAMQSLWTIPYHGLAAAVVLAINMIVLKNQETIDRRRRDVERARLALERLSPTSRIARRGLQVIADLMIEIEAILRDRHGASPEAMNRVIKNIKLPANEMRDTVTISPQASLASAQFSPLDFGNSDDASQLLWALQQEVPDVGRLFDGTLGSFDWNT